MRRRWLPVIVAGLFAVPTAALATPLEDPATAFAIDVPDAPGGRVCRVLPLETADPSPECASARPPLAGDQSERVIGVFMLRYPSHDASMGVSVSDREGIGEISEESVALLAPGDEESRTYRNLRRRLLEARDAAGVARVYLFAADLTALVDTDEVPLGTPYYGLATSRAERMSCRRPHSGAP